jgi:hypothetical protein
MLHKWFLDEVHFALNQPVQTLQSLVVIIYPSTP